MKGPQMVVLATATVVAAVGAADQVPTFRAQIDSVRVDALVTEDRRVVRGLRVSDFEITDNGVPQQVDLMSVDEMPLNVVMAFDLSDSMTGERLENLRTAARALLDGLRREDHVALLLFNDTLQRPFALTRELSRVRAALGDLAPKGLTALVDGVYAGLTLTGSDTGRDLLLVFSDGVDTVSLLPPARVVEAARRTNVTVYGVTIRGVRQNDFLKDLSTSSGGRAVEIQSATDLQTTFVDILDEFRQRYVLSFSPRGVSRTGWHRLEVRVKGRRPTITARRGYDAGS